MSTACGSCALSTKAGALETKGRLVASGVVCSPWAPMFRELGDWAWVWRRGEAGACKARSGVGVSLVGQGRYDCYPLKAVKPSRPWSVRSSGEGYGELQTADS